MTPVFTMANLPSFRPLPDRRAKKYSVYLLLMKSMVNIKRKTLRKSVRLIKNIFLGF
tara:strand:- start:522 stop:692 length:171 start_codon:yes stop_codon:yes gene_type:complete